jgi:hypothetical protein
MNIKKTVHLSVIQILLGELTKVEGANKFLLFAMIANIPLPQIFIPYATQAVTIIFMSLFIFYFRKSELVKRDSKSILTQEFMGFPFPVLVLILLTIFAQLSWVPFMTQLVTITLLCSLFIFSRKSSINP